MQELIPIIASAPVDTAVRKKWLDRLFEAIQEDDPPYIEHLGDHWGDLCATPELASLWANQLLPIQRNVLRERKRGTYAFFSGTTLCYSALFKAGRHDELLELLAMDPRPIWQYLIWGARVLAARGQVDEAIAYVRERAGSSTSLETIARFAEEALLQAGRRAEAFDQYALLANQANSNLSTFRALAKKYPELAPDKLLGHLIASTPGEPGKWFATAKTLKLFDRATQLAWASPCDPKTLTRAARDHLTKLPAFAMQAALAALHWMSMGHGYELTGLDAHEAHRLAIEAAAESQQTEQAQATIDKVLAQDRPMSAWLRRSLGLPVAASKPTRLRNTAPRARTAPLWQRCPSPPIRERSRQRRSRSASPRRSTAARTSMTGPGGPCRARTQPSGPWRFRSGPPRSGRGFWSGTA
ncbi:MAG: hypothetical protein IPN37_08795 [Betaproteobacteria bacterium]|nr:hypothetical protein [Betaproteobacteria bacterium]